MEVQLVCKAPSLNHGHKAADIAEQHEQFLAAVLGFVVSGPLLDVGDCRKDRISEHIYLSERESGLAHARSEESHESGHGELGGNVLVPGQPVESGDRQAAGGVVSHKIEQRVETIRGNQLQTPLSGAGQPLHGI
eukprot:scaffold1307_cov200-Pinguiococcus_pyrenoidosus.AAC.16